MPWEFTLPNGKKVLHLHIPKCGGRFIENTTGKFFRPARYADLIVPSDLRHALFWHAVGEFDHTFTIIRSPADWYVSWFRWIYRITRNFTKNYSVRYWHPHIPLLKCLPIRKTHVNEGFRIFMTNMQREFPGFVRYLYQLYLPDAEFVLRREDLSNNFADLLHHLGCPEDQTEIIRMLPPANRSIHPQSPVWPDGLREQIENEEEGWCPDLKTTAVGLTT